MLEVHGIELSSDTGDVVVAMGGGGGVSDENLDLSLTVDP